MKDWPATEVKLMNTDKLVPYARNSRQNEETAQVVARSIEQYGWQQPLVIDDDYFVDVIMTLTAPGCPVAETFPGIVENAVKSVV